MPIPFRGLVAVAEYGSKFEADVALGSIRSAGIDATLSYDPAMNSVAGYMASERTFDVLVAEPDLAAARRALESAATLPPAFRDEAMGDWAPRQRRHRGGRVVRVTAFAVAVVFVGLPLLALLLGLLAHLV